MSGKLVGSNLISIALVSVLLAAVLVTSAGGLPRYLDSWLTIWLPKTFGTAIVGFLLSGIIPIGWWAMLRFNAARARGPISVWWALLIVAAYLQWSGLLFNIKL